MSIHQHQPTSLFSLLLWDRLLFPPNNPLLTTAARTATGSSGSSRSLVSTWCSSLLARTSSFFSAPSLDAGTTAVARGTAGSPEAQLLERATEAISKRSSSPPSSPPSRAHERGGTEPNSNGSDSKTKNSNTVAEALVELCLTLGIVVISSYLLSLLTRRMLKGYPGNELLEDGDNVPAGSVYAKLERILQKRASQQLTTTTATATKATTAATTAKITVPHLTPRELQMADEILDPDDIESSFADIGGLDNTKQEIYELAVLPLVRPELFGTSKLVQPVKGMLLYGKPGTGKTMLAKALAKESQAVFLPLQLSKILNKYWGESNKLIAATFSLAHKVQPAVIFIDELDTFLKNTNSETAFMDSIKAEFLTLWDGVATASTSRVLVLGATNKPHHIDSAILRRMPRAFEVPLPNADGRRAILDLLLKDERVDASVPAALPHLVAATVGYSGSDLKEVCRAAAMVPVRERTSEFARRRVMGEDTAMTTETAGTTTQQQQQHPPILRALCANDLKEGLRKVRRTGAAAQQYGQKTEREQQQQEEQQNNQQRANGNNNNMQQIDLSSLQNLATLLRSLSQLSTDPARDEPMDEIPELN